MSVIFALTFAAFGLFSLIFASGIIKDNGKENCKWNTNTPKTLHALRRRSLIRDG